MSYWWFYHYHDFQVMYAYYYAGDDRTAKLTKLFIVNVCIYQ